MRRGLVIVLVACIVLVPAAAGADRGLSGTAAHSDTVSEGRVALVVGNSNYKYVPLRNPVNDASAMADALGKLGFAVTLVRDAGYADMNKAVDDFGTALRRAEVALFYYAGHGFQVGGENYLVPVNADISAENEVRYHCVNAGLVLAKMENAPTEINLMILDACRNNPFERSFRTSMGGLAPMQAIQGALIAFSTSPGSVASDEGLGTNSIYTASLLKRIFTPDIKVEDLFKQVRVDVITSTNNAQVPWENTSLLKDFYFVCQSDPEGETEPPRPADDNQRVDMGGGVILEMMWIPPGEFRMGSPLTVYERYKDETAHRVILSEGFWMGKYEVTQAQWLAVMGSNPSHFRTQDNLPVETVSWESCQAFVRKLNERVSNGGFRLPTEAEWEYAARAGTTTDFFFGDNPNLLDGYAWYDENSGSKTHSIGQKRPNAWGLYDITGNVWEWCQDWYGRYETGTVRNPGGPASGRERVLRGGSWARNKYSCRSPLRGKNAPAGKANHYGLRLVRDGAPPP